MPNYTTKQCPVCGKEFQYDAVKHPSRVACSRSCGARRLRLPASPKYRAEDDTYELQLGNGKVTIVDAIDADLGAYKWTLVYRAGILYAQRIGHGYMHRAILQRILGRKMLTLEYTDHIDHDGLNNRRSNLRLATPLQNMANTRAGKTNKSGFKGAWKSGKCWVSQITKNGRRVHLGSFATPEEAHEAYMKAAREQYGDFACGTLILADASTDAE